jgi:PAS domain S-box-containing protein
LRALTETVLGGPLPTFLLWGPERRMIYNDAYAEVCGPRHPRALGRRFDEVWLGVAPQVTETVDKAYAGEAAWMADGGGGLALSATPINYDGEAAAGVFCVCLPAIAPGASEQRFAFQLELDQRLSTLADPGEVLTVAAHALGERLGVSRAGYAEVEADGEQLLIAYDWTDGAASSATGRFRIGKLSQSLADDLLAGRPLRIADVAADPRAEGGMGQRFAMAGARAILTVPLVRGGRLSALLYLHHAQPHVWTSTETKLAEDAAQRIWTAVERARAETTLRESEARFRVMADSAPAPVWVTAAEGGIEFVNQGFMDYAGRERHDLLGDSWISLLHPDDLPGVDAVRAEGRSKLQPYTFEARFRRYDGEWRRLQANSRPRFDGAGAFLGFVGLAIDVTDIRAAEAALRESEERFRLVAENAPVNLWMGDANGACVYLNRAQREFWGVSEDLSNFDWRDTLAPEDREAVLEALTEAALNHTPLEVEGRYWRADGAVRTLRTRAEPRRDTEGRFVGMIGVNVDVTTERQAALDQRLLINELNHRVKNTLATVQSIARQTLRGSSPSKPASELLASRLMALSAAHNVLTRENWQGADLHEVVAQAVAPYDVGGPSRVVREGPPVRIAARTALALSMALHELATNAAKYGSLSVDRGLVRVNWTMGDADDPGRVHLEWREVDGPAVAPPKTRGFGSRLLQQGLAIDLGGSAELIYAPSGLVCRIHAPIGGHIPALELAPEVG